jgi:integrase
MPRQASGAIETHAWRDGRTVTIRARVRAYGRRYRIDFGTNHEGWSVERARVELDRILQQIERGTWEPPSRDDSASAALDAAETIHVTASRWWQRRKAELAANTRLDYRWRLDHVLRHLARETTAELDAHRVDTFRGELVAGGLSPRSVNMIFDLLAQILDDAVELRAAEREPGARQAPPREGPQAAPIVPGARHGDRPARRGRGMGAEPARAPALRATCVAGDLVPRRTAISELTQATLARADLEAGGLQLGLKTAEGIDRHLELSAFLVDELRAHVESLPAALRERHDPAQPLFPTRNGGRLNQSNLRNRLLKGTSARDGKPASKGVVERTNEKRAADGRMLLPASVTPHTLRRTFASLCFFAGRDLRWVIGQLGHADPRMTLGIYAQCMKRKRIDQQIVWTLMRFPDEPERRSEVGMHALVSGEAAPRVAPRLDALS